MRFQKVLSLGYACDVAHQIRRILNQTEAYPFDWLLTPLDAIEKMIRTEFADFLHEANLRADEACVFDQSSGIRFLHDFTNLQNFHNELDGAKEKYHRRIARWLDLTRQKCPVLFVRSQKLHDRLPLIDYEAARRLLDVIGRHYTSISPHLLVVQPEDSTIPDRRGEDVTMVKMPNSLLWSGDDERWDALLADICGTSAVDEEKD
jgi:hypothetical protein